MQAFKVAVLYEPLFKYAIFKAHVDV